MNLIALFVSPLSTGSVLMGFLLVTGLIVVLLVRHPSPRPVWEMGRQMQMGGFGLLILAQQGQATMDPEIAAVIGIVILLFVLAWACGAFDEESSQPRQRTLADYLEDLRRESEDYLDKIDRLYRKR